MKILYLLSGLLVATSSVSCDKTDDPNDPIVDTLSVDKTELSFSQKGESEMFAVSCSGGWYLAADGLSRYIGPNAATVKDFFFEPAWGSK